MGEQMKGWCTGEAPPAGKLIVRCECGWVRPDEAKCCRPVHVGADGSKVYGPPIPMGAIRLGFGLEPSMAGLFVKPAKP